MFQFNVWCMSSERWCAGTEHRQVFRHWRAYCHEMFFCDKKCTIGDLRFHGAICVTNLIGRTPLLGPALYFDFNLGI